MKELREISGYHYNVAGLGHAHAYLLPTIERILSAFFSTHDGRKRVFDLGCGNGSVAQWLNDHGYDVAGADASSEGIAIANAAYPSLNLQQRSAYDDLSDHFGTFPVVISLEVIEHVYAPRDFARSLFALIEDGGIAVVSTPYHGYLKNIALVLSGSFDHHVNPLWDHGHIKFWSMATISSLLEETGFTDLEFHRVGRIPSLAKSMIVIARKTR